MECGVLLEVSTAATYRVSARSCHSVVPIPLSPSQSTTVPGQIIVLVGYEGYALGATAPVIKALAEASLPGEPRIYGATSKRSGLPLLSCI